MIILRCRQFDLRDINLAGHELGKKRIPKTAQAVVFLFKTELLFEDGPGPFFKLSATLNIGQHQSDTRHRLT